jgi:hypothetical protein
MPRDETALSGKVIYKGENRFHSSLSAILTDLCSVLFAKACKARRLIDPDICLIEHVCVVLKVVANDLQPLPLEISPYHSCASEYVAKYFLAAIRNAAVNAVEEW